MSRRKKLWLGGIALFVLLSGAGAYIAASFIAKQFEPTLRAQAIQILLPHGRGAIVAVEGDGFAMRFGGDPSRPPLFSIKKVFFTLDLGVLFEPKKSVNFVSLDGMEINVPPKGERKSWGGGEGSNSNVIIRNVQIKNAALVLLPKDPSRKPLRFQISRLQLETVGVNSAMRYDADLNIPKPPGTVKSIGTFGPWNATEPGDTPLQGNYTFDNVDLEIFAATARARSLRKEPSTVA